MDKKTRDWLLECTRNPDTGRIECKWTWVDEPQPKTNRHISEKICVALASGDDDGQHD
jgi:hypothetical protein